MAHPPPPAATGRPACFHRGTPPPATSFASSSTEPPGSREPGFPPPDRFVVVVIEVRQGKLAQPVRAEGLDLCAGERPGHRAGVVVLVARSRDHQQPATRRD